MTLKQFIFKQMEKNGYVLDVEVARFTKKEFSFNTVEEYKREYKSLEWAKEQYKDLKNPELKHSGRRYLIRDKNWEDNLYQVIPKSYYLKRKNEKRQS